MNNVVAQHVLLDPARIQPRLLGLVKQRLPAARPAARQHHQVRLHVALAVVRVRHVCRQLVKLGRADRADTPGVGGGGSGSGARLGGVAGGCLEGGEAGGESNVQEGRVRQGEESVVSLGEEVGKLAPAGTVEVRVGDEGGGRAGRHGEEAAGLVDLVGVLGSVGDKVLLGVGDGLEEFGLGGLADEFNVLLEAEHELEFALGEGGGVVSTCCLRWGLGGRGAG